MVVGLRESVVSEGGGQGWRPHDEGQTPARQVEALLGGGKANLDVGESI